VFPLVAVAAGLKAQEQGVARLAKSREALHREAERMMRQAREAVRVFMREGLIPAPPADRVGDDPSDGASSPQGGLAFP
jgi:malate dehydrogenase (oxaloacetate-decarboxylating)